MGWKWAKSWVPVLSCEFVLPERQLPSNIITTAGHTQLFEPASPYTLQYSPAGKGHHSCAAGILAIKHIPRGQEKSSHSSVPSTASLLDWLRFPQKGKSKVRASSK